MTSDELAMAVASSTNDTAIVGLQMALVIERGNALSRRAPRLRLALNRPPSYVWRSCAAARG